MRALVVAVMKMTDPASYGRYAAAFPAVFARHEGSVLAADAAPERLEGVAADKIVVLSFPDAAAARRFLEDPDYQAISADRRQGALVDAWLVLGYA